MHNRISHHPYILPTVIITAVLGTTLSPSDITGWMLFAFSFALINLEFRLKRDIGLLYTAWLVIAAHHLVSIVNAYFATVVGAEFDALMFHTIAANQNLSDTTLAVSANFYRNLLIIAYEAGGNSLFLGEQLSNIAFTVTFLVFNRLLGLLQIDRFRIAVLLIFGLMPHILVYTSITLREPFQLLFFVSAVYYGLLFQAKREFVSFILFAGCCVCLALFHQVLIPFALLLILSTLAWSIRFRSWRSMAISALAILTITVGIAWAGTHLLRTHKVLGGEIILVLINKDLAYFLKTIHDYRKAGDIKPPRTGFNIDLDSSSLAGLVTSALQLYLHYLFEPFPRNIREFKDIVAATVSLLRMAAILLVFYGLFRGNDRRTITYITFLYLAMCATWLLGTTNYGQASRHHVLSDWLLLLVAGFSLEEISLQLRQRMRPRH